MARSGARAREISRMVAAQAMAGGDGVPAVTGIRGIRVLHDASTPSQPRWRGSWRAWTIQSRKLSMLTPSSLATWVTGTVWDRVSRTAWWRNSGEYGATHGRWIGMGRSAKVAVAGRGRSRLVGGGRSRSLCGYRHGDNASTGHDVSLPGQCGRCAGDCPLFGCKSKPT